MRNALTVLMLGTTTPPALAAAAPAAAEGPGFLWDLVAVVVPLLFVMGALLAVLYYARRRFRLTGRDAPLSVVQILPVGPRERIVVVRTRRDRILAVGVAAQALTLIAELDPEDIAPDSPNLDAAGTDGRSRFSNG